MKKTQPWIWILAVETLLLLCLILASAFAEEPEEQGFLIVDNGVLQPVVEWSDLREENYTNEGSDILRFCVWVETDYDTDLDGKADLVKALVQVPRAAVEGTYKAAVIDDPIPYGTGMRIWESSMSKGFLIPAGFTGNAQSASRPGS